MNLADADRDRILATLMEEWSPLQRDLMDRLVAVGEPNVGRTEVRNQTSEIRKKNAALSSQDSSVPPTDV